MKMSPNEKAAVSGLAFLFSIRMLGLFMVLPIISIYGQSLVGSTHVLIGLAVGIYGLSQALFQIPFGWLSDQIGRKPVIFVGLGLFILGSWIAAVSEHVIWLIVGRALQGVGAVASTIMALLTDLTREQNRSKAMGILGGSIGLSFALALVLGPVLANWLGLSGVFYVIAVLGILGILICKFFVPNPAKARRHREVQPVLTDLKQAISNIALLRINLGIFVLHAAMSAFFLVIPLTLTNTMDIDVGRHWTIYLPVLGVSFLFMIPLILIAEKFRQIHLVVLGMIGLLLVSQFILVLQPISVITLVLSVFIYFIGFNTLEALLPSMLSKLAPAGMRGTCMGVYSTCQFLGAFVGGVAAGFLLEAYGMVGVFIALIVAFGAWMLVAARMGAPIFHKSMVISLDHHEVTNNNTTENGSGLIYEGLEDVIGQQPGVTEVVLFPEDRVVHLKVDPKRFKRESLADIEHLCFD